MCKKPSDANWRTLREDEDKYWFRFSKMASAPWPGVTEEWCWTAISLLPGKRGKTFYLKFWWSSHNFILFFKFILTHLIPPDYSSLRGDGAQPTFQMFFCTLCATTFFQQRGCQWPTPTAQLQKSALSQKYWILIFLSGKRVNEVSKHERSVVLY